MFDQTYAVFCCGIAREMSLDDEDSVKCLALEKQVETTSQ